jgi:hypothetical protein
MITIQEVRDLLWEDGSWLSDQQIEEIIHTYSMYSRFMIAQHIADKKKSIRKELSV